MNKNGLMLLETAERWLDGRATSGECETKARDVWVEDQSISTRAAIWVTWAGAIKDDHAEGYARITVAACEAAQYTERADPSTTDIIWLYYRELADPVGTLVEGLGLK